MAAFGPAFTGALEGLDGLVQAVPGVREAQNIAALANSVRDRDGDDLRRQQNQALENLQAKQQLQEQQLAEDNAQRRDEMAVRSANKEENRRAALRRAVARQRASFGARGVGANASGSSQAVLLGLFEESDDDRKANERLDQVRSASFDQNLSQRRSLNVLQRTQLQERQKLQRELDRSGFGESLF